MWNWQSYLVDDMNRQSLVGHRTPFLKKKCEPSARKINTAMHLNRQNTGNDACWLSTLLQTIAQ